MNAKVFYLDVNDCFELEDIEKIEEILSIDKKAIIVDGYYTCPFANGDEDGKVSNIEFMIRHIRWRYEEHYCQLADFYSSHNKEKKLEVNMVSSEIAKECEQWMAKMNVYCEKRQNQTGSERNVRNIRKTGFEQRRN